MTLDLDGFPMFSWIWYAVWDAIIENERRVEP